MAEEGKLDPVVGREEIERVCQILSRRKRTTLSLLVNLELENPLLRRFSLQIIQKKVSRILFNKRVVTLTLQALLLELKGQFEERMKANE
jgi:ATP-dependent Clp protease ATP-binding subunit ClpC